MDTFSPGPADWSAQRLTVLIAALIHVTGQQSTSAQVTADAVMNLLKVAV